MTKSDPQVLNCLEDSTFSNPVHTSATRMCGDKPENLLLSGRQYLATVMLLSLANKGSVKPIKYSLPG